MIDTDKYEGHTEGSWECEEWDEGNVVGPVAERHNNNHPIIAVVGDGWWGDMMPECDANKKLITDAPLLLAEVKRLRDVIKKIKDCATINAQHDDILEKQEWEYILELIE